MAIFNEKYDYTVSLLLHNAGRHRESYDCEPNSYNCQCEDDHVIELQLVVVALNKLPEDTYTGSNWQARLVDFFDKKHRNWEHLSRNQRLEKARAVDKWIRRRQLKGNEWKWIKEIKITWKKCRDQLKGFGKFKLALNSVLRTW